MKRIISVFLLLAYMQINAQQPSFYQTIEKPLMTVKIDAKVKNVFIFFDSSYNENHIIINGNIESHPYATMLNDTLFIVRQSTKKSKSDILINIYLKQIPENLILMADSRTIFTNLNTTYTKKLNITNFANADLSVCCINDLIIDSLNVIQQKNSSIYFSKLSIKKYFYLKSQNALFQSSESDISSKIQNKILSNNSRIKIKGYTTKRNK